MKRFLLLGLALAVVAGGVFAFVVGTLLTRPVLVDMGDPPADLSATAVTFSSASGSVIHGWLSSAEPSAPTVVLLPGVRANRLSMVDRARMLRRAGYNVLLVGLQATGESKGDMITFGWLERLDVIAAVEFLGKRSSSPVVLLGTSLGGAAALFGARELRIDALVLESVYPDVEQATKNRLRMYLGRVGPLGSPMLLAQLRPRLGIAARDLRPIEYLQFVRCPVLFIGGSKDRHTTPQETSSMYDAARQPKELWLVPGAAHVDLYRFAPNEYEQRVLRFLNRALSSKPAG